MLPSFLIAGVARAGTTWLATCLAEHPDVFIPVVDEPEFFSRHFDKGLKWYESLFGKWSGQTAIGEKSIGYLTSPYAAERIRRTLGAHVKLIFSLRNPVERAYSAYRMFLSRGRIPVDMDFRTSLNLDRFRVRSTSKYAANLRRYLELFPRKNLLILLYEELSQDSQRTMGDCLRLLGVDLRFAPPSLNVRVNKGVDVTIMHKGFWRLRRSIRKLLPRAAEKPLATVGRHLFEWLPKRKRFELLPEQVRQELLGDFMPDIEQLEHLLDRDLAVWYGRAHERAANY